MGEHVDRLVQENVTPLLTHWSYVFLALTHRYVKVTRVTWQVDTLISQVLIKQMLYAFYTPAGSFAKTR